MTTSRLNDLLRQKARLELEIAQERAENTRLSKMTPEEIAREKNRNAVYNSYRFGELLKQGYHLDFYGKWSIYGDDPNCDLGGHHHTPLLGHVEGTLYQAVEYAITLGGFFQWGPGHIEPMEVVEIKKL